jgi:hypothetical protein
MVTFMSCDGTFISATNEIDFPDLPFSQHSAVLWLSFVV